jgi:DNA (cytosine-5)-methyltransferase 1
LYLDPMSMPKAISLFTGAGGLDYGFEAAGIETAIAVEMDRDCCETLRRNRRWAVVEDRLENVPTEAILARTCLLPGEVDLVIGGPPCQPFSKSGFWAAQETRRMSDPRARSTIEHFLRVVLEARPRAFLLENVEGLGYRGKSEGLDHLREHIERINAAVGTSYRLAVGVLSAADFGVPQHRRRMFVVASRDGRGFVFPTPTHADTADALLAAGLERHRTAWDALWDLPQHPNEDLAVRGKWASLLPSIPEGANYLHHTARGDGDPLFGWRTRYWSFLLKIAKNQPSWTIQAQPGPATGPFHWSSCRLSRRELCRLQTFPDDIEITGDYAAVHRQVGNAVPSLLAEVLARAIREQLLDTPAATPRPLLLRDRSPRPCPPPEPVGPVPAAYHQLRGRHEAHPGTGRGPRALALALARTAAGAEGAGEA